MFRSTEELCIESDPVLVCGAGAAGLAAALAAAAAGANVLLVEATARTGGTVVAALIHTLAGFYDSAGQLLHNGLPRDFIERLVHADRRVRPRKIGRVWVLDVCPKTYQAVVERWMSAEPKISLVKDTQVVGVRTEEDRVVEVRLLGPAGRVQVHPRSVVDATGTAEVVAKIDPGHVENEPTQAAGLIFRIRGVGPDAVRFPQSIAVVRAAREAVAQGALPPSCRHVWIDRGFYDDEAFVKLPVPLAIDWRERRAEIEREAGEARDRLMAFLKTLPGFAQVRITQSGAVGVREGGRIRGRYRLTADDVRSLRHFPDAACRGAWPIEYWHPERGILLEHLPEGGFYEVPLPCLVPQGLTNVWAAGKCLSADPLAQASARVVGCCWAMGEAAGRAAAAC